MRELGIIVNDVSERHYKDEQECRTQAIYFSEQNHSIPLSLKATLFTFKISKPTMEEYLKTPEESILDVAIEHWNPQEHTQDMLHKKPPVQVNQIACINQEEINNLIYDPVDMNVIETFFDTYDEEFWDTKDSGEGIKDLEEDKEFTSNPNLSNVCYYFTPSHKEHGKSDDSLLHLDVDHDFLGETSSQTLDHKDRVYLLLDDFSYNHLVGQHKTFDTLVCVLSTVEKLH